MFLLNEIQNHSLVLFVLFSLICVCCVYNFNLLQMLQINDPRLPTPGAPETCDASEALALALHEKVG